MIDYIMLKKEKKLFPSKKQFLVYIIIIIMEIILIERERERVKERGRIRKR